MSVFQSEHPVLHRRGVHLDLKGLPPTPARLLELLHLFAALRINTVLVEWEDAFPWTVDERFRSPTAYTPDAVAQFVATAAELDLELIPLVQCLGHMETPLSVAGYEHLQEVAGDPSGLNPLASGARELIQHMVDDVLALMPDVKHFHLGGDEARALGKNDATRAYIEKHGKGALYLHHVEPILDTLNARQIRPILWHDMMIDWDSDALHALAAKADLMAWGYDGDPDTTTRHYQTQYIERFADHGITLWGGTAYKGAEGYDADVADFELHTENAMAWVRVAKRFDFEGVIATAWSRYFVGTLQCNPIDACLDSLVNVAGILHDGAWPADHENTQARRDACIATLHDHEEGERFDACFAAMDKLKRHRTHGWRLVQDAHQAAMLAKIDAARVSAAHPAIGLHAWTELEKLIERNNVIADQVRQALTDLVDPIWIDEYLATRLQPLQEAHAHIKTHVL